MAENNPVLISTQYSSGWREATAEIDTIDTHYIQDTLDIKGIQLHEIRAKKRFKAKKQ